MPNLTLHSPLGGVNRRTDFQSQPPYTCYDASNFWSIDGANKRRRVSTRPGWALLGSGGANMFAAINVAAGESADQQLVKTAGGTFYKWASGSWSSVTGGTGMSTAANLASAPFLNKLYIPNHGTPKVYTFVTAGGTLGTFTADFDEEDPPVALGTVPQDCTLACTWANRIVFAAPSTDPNNWYMSRVDVPGDWRYAADDTGSPVAGNNIEGGLISEPLTALIPHNRECIIFCTYNGMTVLRGNPTDGGRMESISKTVGPVSRNAWCRTADDWTYMLTRDGLYKMQPGCGSNPFQVSRKKIPQNLLAIDPDDDDVSMAYCPLFGGIYIEINGATDTAWWYDLEYEAFWPWTPLGATAMMRFAPEETTTTSGLLVGTATSISRLNTATALGQTFFATMGPFKMSKNRRDKSIIAGATAVFGDTTTDTTGTVNFYGAEDAETVIGLPTGRKYTAAVSTFNRGDVHPRIGGHAGYITYVVGSTAKHVSIEEMNLDIKPAGRERK